MKSILLGFFVFIMSVMLTISTSNALEPPHIGLQTPIGFETNIDIAFATAKDKDVPLFVMFCIPSCGPCNQLKKHVLTNPRTRLALSGYELLYVNAENHSEFAKQYDITSYPTMLVLSPSGKEWSRFRGGSANITTFIERLKNTMSQSRQTKGLEEALQANPNDAALLTARGLLRLRQADIAPFSKAQALRLLAKEDFLTAHNIDNELQEARAELYWFDLEEKYQSINDDNLQQAVVDCINYADTYPNAHNAAMALWKAASTTTDATESLRLYLRLAHEYPFSPQAPSAWNAINASFEEFTAIQ